jgi:hypothetical protein
MKRIVLFFVLGAVAGATAIQVYTEHRNARVIAAASALFGKAIQPDAVVVKGEKGKNGAGDAGDGVFWGTGAAIMPGSAGAPILPSVHTEAHRVGDAGVVISQYFDFPMCVSTAVPIRIQPWDSYVGSGGGALAHDGDGSKPDEVTGGGGLSGTTFTFPGLTSTEPATDDARR